jgi:16S rRNA (guanine527-N7)-methyltransferase
MEPENREILLRGAEAFGIDLAEGAILAFDIYLRELLKWNQKINLTGIRTEKGVVIKHFLDSLSVCSHIPGHTSLLDVGSGAGFPGIPLKMVQRSLQVTLIDSVRKKVDFQKHMVRLLGLRGIEAVHGRVQEEEIVQQRLDRFDMTISRAFSDTATFLHLSHLLLKRGGMAIAMRGKTTEEEFQRLSKEEGRRYRLQKHVSFVLPFSNFERTILLFEKQ